MKFHDESSWLGGTGWLIDEKTVVTAAHNLYEKPTKGATRYAEVVFVTIGSSGTETQKTDKAERRRGKSAAIHLGFYSQDPNSHDAWWEKYDMAVIRLEDPFRESKCFEWRTTPLQEKDVTIEVVGYPGDLPSTADEGLIMYKAQQCIDLNLKRDGHQLSYQLDTAKGRNDDRILVSAIELHILYLTIVDRQFGKPSHSPRAQQRNQGHRHPQLRCSGSRCQYGYLSRPSWERSELLSKCT